MDRVDLTIGDVMSLNFINTFQRNIRQSRNMENFCSMNGVDWIKYDNYMISITQKHLNQGLTAPVSINAETKRFIQQTSKDFFDWIEDGNIQKDVRLYNSNSVNEFKQENKEFFTINNRTFLSWINKYCELNGFKMNKGRDNMGRYFEIQTGNEPVDDTPF